MGSSHSSHLFFEAHKIQPCQRKHSQLHVTEADKLLTLVITSWQWQQITLASIYFVHVLTAQLFCAT